MEEEDDCFKKEGRVPFKWEIRPGVPKNSQPPPPPKLRPPPAAFLFQSAPPPGLGCFPSPFVGSKRRQFDDWSELETMSSGRWSSVSVSDKGASSSSHKSSPPLSALTDADWVALALF